MGIRQLMVLHRKILLSSSTQPNGRSVSTSQLSELYVGRSHKIRTASSVSNDPVVHFVLFVPSADNSPLYILNRDGKSHS